MKLLILFFFSFLLLSGCNNLKKPVRQESFQSFDFTYNDVFSTAFSIQFLQTDTVYIRQHFSLSDNPKDKTPYYAVLSKADKLTLDSFINTLQFKNYDTSYYEGYQDGIDYKFFMLNDTIEKSIRVHSDSVPSALVDFKNWIVEMKRKLQLHQIDTIIHFKSNIYVVPPPAPPPPPAPEECAYKRVYPDSALLRFYPFNEYRNIQLVSFQFHSNRLPIKKNSLLKDSLTENKILSPKEVLELADLLYNNHAKSDAPPWESLCGFMPRNAILFFDNKGQLKSSVLICFQCMEYRKSEEMINMGGECIGKLEKLRSFFIAQGVTFGTKMSTAN